MSFNLGQSLNRIPPNMTPDAYKTYRILAPLETHWRPATCEEFDCAAYLNGWVTTIDESTALGSKQAYFIRHNKTRRYTEDRLSSGLTQFSYGPGNECFASSTHVVSVGRPDRLIVDGGDWRGNPLGTPRVVHTNPEFWVEDFAENQQKLAETIEKG